MSRAAAKVKRPVERGWVSSALLGGIVAGIVSNAVLTLFRGLVVLSWSTVLWLTLGPWTHKLARDALEEFWVALKIAAFPFVGERSLEGGFDTPIVALGLVARVAFSIGSGALFGLIAHGRSQSATVALAMLFAIVFWAASSYYITPPILQSLGRLVLFIPYGLALGFTFLWYQRRFPRDDGDQSREGAPEGCRRNAR